MFHDETGFGQDFPEDSTGDDSSRRKSRTVVVPYLNYEIVVRLTEDDRFIGVEELRIKKDFLSQAQRIANTGVFDVDEFYQG